MVSRSVRPLAPFAGLFLGLLSACNNKQDPGQTGGAGGEGVVGNNYPSEPVAAPYDRYFDPPPSGGKYADDYTVVGSITPPSWSWGKIELLEGHQAYREEG